MVKSGVDTTTAKINQIIVGIFSVEWELSTIVNCYKEKGIGLERRKYKGLTEL